MNERIKELAMIYANKMGNSVLHNADHLEKFAELIIKECAGIAEDGFDDELDGQEICDRIKQYFGVE